MQFNIIANQIPMSMVSSHPLTTHRMTADSMKTIIESLSGNNNEVTAKDDRYKGIPPVMIYYEPLNNQNSENAFYGINGKFTKDAKWNGEALVPGKTRIIGPKTKDPLRVLQTMHAIHVKFTESAQRDKIPNLTHENLTKYIYNSFKALEGAAKSQYKQIEDINELTIGIIPSDYETGMNPNFVSQFDEYIKTRSEWNSLEAARDKYVQLMSEDEINTIEKKEEAIKSSNPKSSPSPEIPKKEGIGPDDIADSGITFGSLPTYEAPGPNDTVTKNSYYLYNAIQSGRGSIDLIKAETKNVIIKTKIVASTMIHHLPPELLKQMYKTKVRDCNQSIFHYPISDTKKHVTPERIKTLLENLQRNISTFQDDIQNAAEKKKNGHDLSEGTVQNTILFAARGALYMKEVISCAGKYLNNLSTLCKKVYPSMEHGFYEGNYHELFAFLLLRYLYKVERGDDITISKDKSFGLKKDKKTAENFLPVIRTYQREATQSVSLGFGRTKNNKAYNKDTFKMGDLNSAPTMSGKSRMMAVSNEDGDIGFTERQNMKWSRENEYKTFLKPTRGTKIMLFGEPNYFAYKMTPQVSRGLSILVNIGCLDGTFIKDLRLCSQHTGGIYKLTITKWGLKWTPITGSTTYGSLSKTNWSQYSVIIDTGVLKESNKQFSGIHDQLYSKAKDMWVTDDYKFINRKFKGDVDALGIIENNKKFKVNEKAWKELERNFNKLECDRVTEFVKSLKDSGAKLYHNRMKFIDYQDVPGLEIPGPSFNWSSYPCTQRYDNVDFENIGLNRDIDYDHFVKGLSSEVEYFGISLNEAKERMAIKLQKQLRLPLETDPTRGRVINRKQRVAMGELLKDEELYE